MAHEPPPQRHLPCGRSPRLRGGAVLTLHRLAPRRGHVDWHHLGPWLRDTPRRTRPWAPCASWPGGCLLAPGHLGPLPPGPGCEPAPSGRRAPLGNPARRAPAHRRGARHVSIVGASVIGGGGAYATTPPTTPPSSFNWARHRRTLRRSPAFRSRSRRPTTCTCRGRRRPHPTGPGAAAPSRFGDLHHHGRLVDDEHHDASRNHDDTTAPSAPPASAPDASPAQDPPCRRAGATHVVRPGENLWAIAAQRVAEARVAPWCVWASTKSRPTGSGCARPTATPSLAPPQPHPPGGERAPAPREG